MWTTVTGINEWCLTFKYICPTTCLSDFEQLKPTTLRELDKYVSYCLKKKSSKQKGKLLKYYDSESEKSLPIRIPDLWSIVILANAKKTKPSSTPSGGSNSLEKPSSNATGSKEISKESKEKKKEKKTGRLSDSSDDSDSEDSDNSDSETSESENN